MNRWTMLIDRLSICWLVCLGLLLPLSAVAAETPAAGQGHWLELKTAYSTTFRAYEAGPRDAPAAVLVIPDIWGINEAVIAWADRLGQLPVHVLVVDYYDGRMVTNTAMAHEVYRSIDPVWIDEDIKGGLSYLKGRADSLAILGWGQGAVHALETGRLASDYGIRAMLIYNDARSARVFATRRISSLPLLEVTTRHSLVDPQHPPQASDLESTWRASQRFLVERLTLP